MYKLFVAFRYLTRNWLNLVGVAAVAIGVMVLICVLSVMKGFDEEFRSRLQATLSDLIVESWFDDTFSGYEEMLARIERIPHVAAVAPRYDGLALIRVGKSQRYGEFQGIDLPREIRATDFATYWRAWRGRDARERLTALIKRHADAPLSFAPDTTVEPLPRMPQETPGAPEPPAETVGDLLQRMRGEDHELLDTAIRRRLEAWARAQKVDLKAASAAAEAAEPAWVAMEDPRYSPAFAGAELLVLGQDTDGRVVSMGVGDEVQVVTATDLASIGDNRRIRRCRVVGEFRSGLYEHDQRTIALPLADVQNLMQKPGHVTSINIRLDSYANAPVVRAHLLGILTPEEIAEGINLIRPHLPRQDADIKVLDRQLKELSGKLPGWFATGDPRALTETIAIERTLYRKIGAMLRSSAPGSISPESLDALTAYQQKTILREANALQRKYRVSTWEDKRRTFLRVVWMERRIMGFILFFVILIAGFLILSILHTTVLSKIRDIGTLKAIGGSMSGIMSIFLFNGLLMGTLGSAAGTAAGLFITRNINAIQDILEKIVGYSLFPRDIYYLDRVPVERDPFLSTAVICTLAIATSLVASAYPAWKAARMDSVEALRYE